MKKGFIVFFALMLCSFAFATQTITDLGTNETVGLGQLLTISGNYNDTNSAESIFCKFLTQDDLNLVVERLTDERVFANGDFYAERLINEPLYKRDITYTVTVSCANATEDTNFTVGQRETIAHVVEQETLFIFERGNLDAVFFFGGVFSILIIFVLIYLAAVRKGLNSG